MTDIYTAEERSKIMGLVQRSNTKPEIYVRKVLHASGYRFRLHRKDLPGCPDIVLPRYRVAVFVHGCFWHGHSCKRGKRPATNIEFWTKKLDANIERDKTNKKLLERAGWDVFIIWQCNLKKDTEKFLKHLSTFNTNEV